MWPAGGSPRAEERAPWLQLRTLALAEDPGSVPNTHIVGSSVPGNLTPLSDF